jgi:hypothetical protein
MRLNGILRQPTFIAAEVNEEYDSTLATVGVWVHIISLMMLIVIIRCGFMLRDRLVGNFGISDALVVDMAF